MRQRADCTSTNGLVAPRRVRTQMRSQARRATILVPNGGDGPSGTIHHDTLGPASRRINSAPSPAWPPSGRPCRRRTHRRSCAVNQPSREALGNAKPRPRRRISAIPDRRSHVVILKTGRSGAVRQPSREAPGNANPRPHRRIGAVPDRRSHLPTHSIFQSRYEPEAGVM